MALRGPLFSPSKSLAVEDNRSSLGSRYLKWPSGAAPREAQVQTFVPEKNCLLSDFFLYAITIINPYAYLVLVKLCFIAGFFLYEVSSVPVRVLD